MSLPQLTPAQSVAGIAVDQRTLERVIPESRRSDGSVRPARKVRPGFTPQEDVSRFRGTRQEQMDSQQLPKGHILGWVAPSATTGRKPLTKAAAKNAKRREKKETSNVKDKPVVEDKPVVKDSWEDDDDNDNTASRSENGGHTLESPNWAKAPPTIEASSVEKTYTEENADGVGVGKQDEGDVLNEPEGEGEGGRQLADELQKLEVR